VILANQSDVPTQRLTIKSAEQVGQEQNTEKRMKSELEKICPD